MDAITANEIRAELKAALKEFGEYSFIDKGAREVMDIDAVLSKLNEMPASAVIMVLEDVYKSKAKSRFAAQLVSELVQSMDEVSDVRWAELMTSEILKSCYE